MYKNNNTFSRNDSNKKKRKLVDSVINRTFITGFSNCGKTYLMNHILLRKQEPILIYSNSLYQYPNIKAQTSNEIQLVKKSENSTVVFDDLLLSKQESNTVLFFTKWRHNNIDIYYTSQIFFICQKILFVTILIKIFFFQTNSKRYPTFVS